MRALKVIGLFVLVWGAIRLAMGLYVAIALDGSPSAADRYLGSDTSGEAIDQGLYRIIFAVMLLAIVRLVRKRKPE